MKERFTKSENKLKSELQDYEMWQGDSAEMWSGIEDSLDEKKNNKIMIWWIFGVMMSVGVFGVGYWNFDTDQLSEKIEINDSESINNSISTEPTATISSGTTPKTLDVSPNTIKEIKKDEINTIANSSNTKTAASIPSVISFTTESSTNTNSKTLDVSPERKSAIKTISENSTQKISKTVESPDIYNSSSTQNKSANSTLETKNTKTSKDIKSANNPANSEPLHADVEVNESTLAPNEKQNEVNNSSLLEMHDYAVHLVDSTENPCFVINVVEGEYSSVAETKYLLGYYRGVNYHTDGYHFGNSDNSQRKATERGLLGYEEGVTFEYNLGKNVLIGTGVGVSTYNEEFDYSEAVATQLSEKYKVVRYNINTVTMDTTFIIGDRVLQGTAFRDIRHYNSWKMVRIPILFGKQWSTNRLTFKALGGVSLERRIAQETKDSSNDFELFIQSATTPTFRKLAWNIEFVPTLDVKISPRFKASFTLPLRYAMTTWDYKETTNESFAVKRPVILAANMGLKYAF